MLTFVRLKRSIMKALLPVYCRPLGYVVLLIALFIPFLLPPFFILNLS